MEKAAYTDYDSITVIYYYYYYYY